MNADLLDAIAVTAELTGTELSKGALHVMLDDLSEHPVDAVLAALTRCRRELKGRLTLSDILSRIEDGRPGAETAWSMIPHNELLSCVWTEEMRDAFAYAAPLIRQGDKIAARMAFKEAYEKAVEYARKIKQPVNWVMSFGFNAQDREDAVLRAVEKKQITLERAKTMLPDSPKIMALVGEEERPLLENQNKIQKLISNVLQHPTIAPGIEYDETMLLSEAEQAFKKINRGE